MKAFIAWIKQWARTAYEAATSVAFYRRAGERKTGEAFGHLMMLTVLWSLPICVTLFIGLRQVTVRVAAGLSSDIPPGTVFEMKGGHLTNNLKEPLIFRQEGVVVIVNAASSTLGLSNGENGVIVNADSLEQRDGTRLQTVNYKDAPDFRLSREDVMSLFARWAPLAIFLGSLFMLVFMILIFWSGIIVNAALHGFVLWLILKALKRPRSWRESFVIAAYAATASVLADIVLLGVQRLSSLPGLFYWAFILWIAYDAYKGGSHGRKEGALTDGPAMDSGSKTN